MSASMVMSFMPSIAFAGTDTEAKWLKNDKTGDWEFHVYTTAYGGTTDEVLDSKASFKVVPTCTEQGVKVWTVNYNGNKLTKEDTVPALGHTKKYDYPTKQNMVYPTCTEDGSYDLVIPCGRKDCDGYYSKETVVVPAQHVANEPVIENKKGPCNTGITYDEVVYCKDCGAEISRESKKNQPVAEECTAGKPVKENVVEATCELDGSYDEVVRCTVCGDVLSSTHHTVNKLGHTAGEAVRENVVEATCEKAGSCDEVVYCTVCGKEISRNKVTVDALPHTIEYKNENIIDATCQRHMVTYDKVKYCSVCNNELARTFVVRKVPENRWKHQYEEVVVKEPTCEEDGEAKNVCSLCGHEDSERVVLKKTGHTLGEPEKRNFVAATCENEGHYDLVQSCTVCKKVVSLSTIKTDEKLGHNYEAEFNFSEDDPTKVVVKLTCTNKGCDAVVIKAADVVKDSSNFVVDKAATCVSEGLGHYTVTVNYNGQKFVGDSPISDTIPALPHSNYKVEKENVVDATCTEAGSYEYVVYCADCGKELSRENKTVDALGHKEVDVKAVAPTCTEPGLTAGKKCETCGEVTVPQKEVPALGHKEVDLEAVAPTVFETGLTAGKKCETCGEVLEPQNEVDKLKVAKATVSVKAGKKSFTVKASAANATGYRVYYKKSGAKKYSYTTVKAKNLRKTVKKLSKGKKYTVKVKAYAKNYDGDGEVVWGALSSGKTVKVK